MWFGMRIFASEYLTEKSIDEALDLENPFVYEAIGKALTEKELLTKYRGAYDTVIQYEESSKEYAVSQGKFRKLSVQKPFANGIELDLTYRKAEGIQEYDNIKTGKEGELLAGIKVPLIQAFKNISKREIALIKAKIRSQSEYLRAKVMLRKLYRKVLHIYYRTLYYQELMQSEEALLQKAYRNDSFIRKEIGLGKRAEVESIESQKVILSRKQRLYDAKRRFMQSKNMLLQYLGLESDYFDKMYRLPGLPRSWKERKPTLEHDAISFALANRPELVLLELALKRIDAQKQYVDLGAYPNITLKYNQSYDFLYKDGYKVSLDAKMPIQRRAYKGEYASLQKEKMWILRQKNALESVIETNVKNIISETEIVQAQVKASSDEIEAVRRLEYAEYRRYQEGVSQLVELNRREVDTLQSEQKLLGYYLRISILMIDLAYETGRLHLRAESGLQ